MLMISPVCGKVKMGSLIMNIGHKLGGKLQMDNGTTSFVLLTDISDNGHIGLTLRNDPDLFESLFGRFNRRWVQTLPLFFDLYFFSLSLFASHHRTLLIIYIHIYMKTLQE
jgi:hypothetical protein